MPPYQPPQVPPNQPVTEAPIYSPPAPLVLRLINYIVDKVISYSFVICSSAIIYISLREIWHVKLNDVGSLLYFGIGSVVLFFCYYFILELVFGRTFGKALTGTQVLTDLDTRPSLGKLALRTIGRAIPLDEIVIFFNKSRTLHDSIADTKVVKSIDLPEELRRQGNGMKIVAIILLLPIIALFGWVGFERVTGGERIALSQNIPADLQLVRYEELHKDDSKYYALTYQGKGRTIQLNRIIAGYDFDPDEACVYMTPTKAKPFGFDAIDKAIDCTRISPNKEKIQAYKVNIHSPLSVDDEQIPDYYLSKPPYRYTVKATSGSLSDKEILAMTKNYKTYTADQLTAMAKSKK